MTGLDVVREIKKTKPSIPVIILSGNNDKSAVEDAKNAGITDYIVKDGYFIDNLIERVSKILPTTVSTGGTFS
jgi:CheY-like chemotaxis protein